MTPTEMLRTLLWERGGQRCGLCGDRLALHDMHVDHITPLSAGGVNSTDNLQPSHATCNISKGGQNRIRAYEKRELAAARRAAAQAAKAAAQAAQAAAQHAVQVMDPSELRARREALHLSTYDLAREFRVAPSSVLRWESGAVKLHGLTAIGADTVLKDLERRDRAAARAR